MAYTREKGAVCACALNKNTRARGGGVRCVYLYVLRTQRSNLSCIYKDFV